jgi:hypothetical protein
MHASIIIMFKANHTNHASMMVHKLTQLISTNTNFALTFLSCFCRAKAVRRGYPKNVGVPTKYSKSSIPLIISPKTSWALALTPRACPCMQTLTHLRMMEWIFPCSPRQSLSPRKDAHAYARRRRD